MNARTITIFTPIYNRATFLLRLFDSLVKQTYKNFEWIIVDDGSSDNIRDVVNALQKKGKLDIQFIHQKNGGKHRAINVGVELAKGELFFILDSDDILPPNALELVVKYYEEIKNDSSFAGVSGIDGYFDGRIIGSGLPLEVLDSNSIDIHYKYHVIGDMKEVFRTSVMREIPFPEIENEKFCPEDLVWNRIAQKYKLRYFNKVIYNVEYQPEGLTAKIVKIRMKSPIASTICYGEMLDLDIPIKSKIKAAINYWRFYLCIKNKSKAEKKIAPLWICLLPVGLFFHIKDRLVAK